MSKNLTEYKKKVKEIYDKSNIVLSNDEINSIDHADFGLDNIEKEGLNLILYVNNDRYCAKEMAMLPNQTCPEHWHPDLEDRKGKQETFRCRWGDVYLYTDEPTETKENNLSVSPPEESKDYYTARKEIHLLPGEQYTIDPGIKHWFKAGDKGAVISEFSSPSFDEYDLFTNPNVNREIRDR